MSTSNTSSSYNKIVRGGLKLKSPGIITKQYKHSIIKNNKQQLQSSIPPGNNNNQSNINHSVKHESIKHEHDSDIKPEQSSSLEYIDYELPDGTTVKQLISHNSDSNIQKSAIYNDKYNVQNIVSQSQIQQQATKQLQHTITKQYIRYGASNDNMATNELNKRSKQKHDKYC